MPIAHALPVFGPRCTGALRCTVHALFAFLPFTAVQAQDVRVNEGAAKQAVLRIVQWSGLQPNFVVRENSAVRTAIAFNKGRKRYIEYDPAFLSRIVDTTRTDWSAVSILAHEIGHHLLGHTLDPALLNPGDELACDRYSGFILGTMGASLEEAMAAIEVALDPAGSAHHPPRTARVEAVRQGWLDRDRLQRNAAAPPIACDEAFLYVVRFEGDENTYYVNDAGRLVWYDNYGHPIGFGSFGPAAAGDFAHELTWEGQTFFVDRHDHIWSSTAHQALMQVGHLEPYVRP